MGQTLSPLRGRQLEELVQEALKRFRASRGSGEQPQTILEEHVAAVVRDCGPMSGVEEEFLFNTVKRACFRRINDKKREARRVREARVEEEKIRHNGGPLFG